MVNLKQPWLNGCSRGEQDAAVVDGLRLGRGGKIPAVIEPAVIDRMQYPLGCNIRGQRGAAVVNGMQPLSTGYSRGVGVGVNPQP